jgi:hypothetical protein
MLSHASKLVLVISMVAVVACGPAGPGNGGNGGADGGSRGSGGTNDGGNNDCGTVTHPEGTPVALPDGVCGDDNDGTCSCTTDADCTSLTPSGQHCWTIGAGDQECRESYTSSVMFSGFGAGQTIAQTSDIVSVCVNMSHEWIRDLEIDLIAPSGQVLALDKFGGQTGNEVFVGNPLNTDGDCPQCTTETGMQYCWTPTTTNFAMLPYANYDDTMNMWNGHNVLPPGTYAASDPWMNLIGATLNGTWTFQVTDLWPIDAGELHSWTISFNDAIVENCSTPPIQ